MLELGASSQTKTHETTEGLNGNPVILSTIVHTSSVQSNVISNNFDRLHCFHVASIFLEKGYIEIDRPALTGRAGPSPA